MTAPEAHPGTPAGDSTRLSLEDVRRIALDVLRGSRLDEPALGILADRIVAAERDGPASHGLFMLPSYVSGLRSGWINPAAVPRIDIGSSIHVDGDNGFAQTGIEAVRAHLGSAARANGIALLTQRNAHHIGALRSDVEGFAEEGLVALMFVATRKRVVPFGGTSALLGTNPFAFAAPVANRPPFVWDMATSSTALTDLRMAAEAGEAVPTGTGVDRDGRPTTDARAILDGGALQPFGGHKGSAIAMMVEILAAGVTGGRFAVEDQAASVPGAASANGGQSLIVIDPQRASGTDLARRLEDWFTRFDDNDGLRLPGDGRLARRAAASRDGILVRSALLAQLQGLAGEPPAHRGTAR